MSKNLLSFNSSSNEKSTSAQYDSLPLKPNTPSNHGNNPALSNHHDQQLRSTIFIWENTNGLITYAYRNSYQRKQHKMKHKVPKTTAKNQESKINAKKRERCLPVQQNTNEKFSQKNGRTM